jgi:adenylate cyclase
LEETRRARFRAAWRWTPTAAGLLPVIIVALLTLLEAPPLPQLRDSVFDSYQRTHPRPFRDGSVRVVDIDDETIRRLGQWPWPRTDVAAMTRAIADAGAAAIVFDIVFSEPDRTSPARIAERAERDGLSVRQAAAIAGLPDYDARFEQVIASAPTVLGFFFTHQRRSSDLVPKAGFAVAGSDPAANVAQFEGAIVPLPPFLAAAKGLGSVSLSSEGGGLIRRLPMLAAMHGQLFPSLSVEALRVAQGAGGIVVRSSDASGELGGSRVEVTALKIGEVEVPVTGRGELWMHFTEPVSERVVPAWRILSGRLPAAEMERLFSGRIVLIGAGAVGLRDLVSTPVQDRELGVMVHAQAVEQMVLGDFLYRPDWSAGVEMLLLVLSGLILAFVLPRLGALRGALLGGAMVALTIGLSWYLFRYQSVLLDPVPPTLALTSGYILMTLLDYVREERQRAYIHRAFDRYLSPELVKRIADDPGQLELGGQERDMTVLFCDIRSFSSLSERMTPQQIIRFLTKFLTPMTDILLARKATIDKFIGDAVLAFWNAPLDDEEQHGNAARGALEMSARLDGLNSEMAQRGDNDWPGKVEIGIGINAGRCCVGNMGSAQRLSYSLIGDPVNVASRIEGLTKQYGVRIAIGEDLAEHCTGFALIELDRVRVVGRERPETVWALIGDEAVAESPPFVQFRALHDAMLGDYRGCRWRDAEAKLEAGVDAAASFGLAKLYALYRERSRAYVENPPSADWDGVWMATIK